MERLMKAPDGDNGASGQDRRVITERLCAVAVGHRPAFRGSDGQPAAPPRVPRTRLDLLAPVGHELSPRLGERDRLHRLPPTPDAWTPGASEAASTFPNNARCPEVDIEVPDNLLPRPAVVLFEEGSPAPTVGTPDAFELHRRSEEHT